MSDVPKQGAEEESVDFLHFLHLGYQGGNIIIISVVSTTLVPKHGESSLLPSQFGIESEEDLVIRVFGATFLVTRVRVNE